MAEESEQHESEQIAASVANGIRSMEAVAEDIRAWFKLARAELDKAEAQAESFIADTERRQAALKDSIDAYTGHIETLNRGMRQVFTDIANGAAKE